MPEPEGILQKYEILLTLIMAPRDEFPSDLAEYRGLVMGKEKAVTSAGVFASEVAEKAIPDGYFCSILARTRNVPPGEDDSVESQLKDNIAALEQELAVLKQRLDYLQGDHE